MWLWLRESFYDIGYASPFLGPKVVTSIPEVIENGSFLKYSLQGLEALA